MNKRSEFGFELFEHTADIGLRIYGAELADVFLNAARGLYYIIFHESPPEISAKGEYQIKLHALDLDQLLIDWLNELLYLFATEQIVGSTFHFSIDQDKYILDAKVAGEIIPDKLLVGICEVKAATYHMLSLKKNSSWIAQVVFDI